MAKLKSIEPDVSVQQAPHPPPLVAPPQHQAPNPPLPMVAAPQYEPPHPPPPMVAAPQYQQVNPENQSVDYSATVMVAPESLAVGKPWKTGLFDCFQDPKSAVMTAYLPCVTFGQIAEVLDAGEMNCALGSYIYLVLMPTLCSHWLMGSKYRAKLRRNYNLVEAPHSDIIAHIFCPWCALAQEFRELKNRGLDPSLGWKGIIAQELGRQNGSLEMNFPPNQGMTRF